MASDRSHVHEIIDQLDSSQLEAIAHLLEAFVDPVTRSLAGAGIESEPASDAEAAALDAAHASIQRGEGIPHEEVLREFGLTSG